MCSSGQMIYFMDDNLRFICVLLHWSSKIHIFLAATKQLYDWFSPSVCPSVTLFSLCSHRYIIMKLSGVIIMDRSDVHAKYQGQRSKVKVTEVKTQLSRFRTVTPAWIHIWQWNHAHSLNRSGALLFFKVICLSNFKVTGGKKLPILTRIWHFWTVTTAWVDRWL